MTGPTGTQKRHRSAVVVITSSGMEKGRLAMSIPADMLKAHNEYSGRCAEGSQRASPANTLKSAHDGIRSPDQSHPSSRLLQRV
jgi:hypothetical protein